MKSVTKLLGLAVASICLVEGCASAPPPKTARPYCHTSQEIKSRNGERVESQTTVSCNDDPIERLPNKRTGVSPRCFENPYQYELPNGRVIRGMNYACQKKDGSWDIIDGRTVN
jgi:hypothetical protein